MYTTFILKKINCITYMKKFNLENISIINIDQRYHFFNVPDRRGMFSLSLLYFQRNRKYRIVYVTRYPLGTFVFAAT